MTWQNYCNKFEFVTRNDKSLSAIRLRLYLSLNTNMLKTVMSAMVSFFRLLIYLTKKPIALDVKNYTNVYLIESPTTANLGTLKPLLLVDNQDKLILLNSLVENSISFKELKDKINYINYEKSLFLNSSDIKLLLNKTLLVSNKCQINLLKSFIVVFKYLPVKNSLDSILSKTGANTIFLSNDLLLASNLSIHIANSYNINNYVLQHGFLTHFYLPVTATNYIVWGQKAKEWFEAQNVNSTILPLGTPRLDGIIEIINNIATIKSEFYNRHKISTHKKIFLYMSHSQAPEFGIELHEQNFIVLRNIIQRADYQLVIKLHPSESSKLLENIFGNELNKIIILPKDENLYHSIMSSHICASAFSTTLVEAMCFNKPTLQMNLAKTNNLPDYSKKEGCISIETHQEFIEILDKNDFKKELERQNHYVKKYFNNLGNASEQILQYVEKHPC